MSLSLTTKRILGKTPDLPENSLHFPIGGFYQLYLYVKTPLFTLNQRLDSWSLHSINQHYRQNQQGFGDMNNVKTLVFAYVRVSSEEQESKHTQENQRRSIKNYAKINKLKIGHWFEDLAKSGHDDSRPAFNEMLDRLDEVEGIIIRDMSRISRNFEHSVKIAFIFKERRKILHISGENKALNYLDGFDKLYHIIKAYFAEEDDIRRKQNQEQGIKRYRESHCIACHGELSEKTNDAGLKWCAHCQSYRKSGGWGRKPKKFNIRNYVDLIKKGIPKTNIAKILEIHIDTLYRKIKLHEAEINKLMEVI